MKLAITTIFILMSFAKIFAQTYGITGIVADNSGAPMIGATVVLVNTLDTTKILGLATELDGKFEFKVSRGNYRLRVVYIGYEQLEKVLEVNANLDLGSLQLRQSTTVMETVTITGKTPPVVQKEDTTQYNSNSYKVNKDANAENLISKMPGITVQDGKVQAQGEDVKRVLVDGKMFFGDDANAVLKNIPAEIIDKIQVFDQQSDQSIATGFSDGNTTKTINIVTKPETRNGEFGKVSGGYGTDDRYKLGINYNIFNGDRRISILGLSNNINEQNFSSDDLLGVMSGSQQGSAGGGRSGGSGGRGGGSGGPHGAGRTGGGGDNSSSFLVNTQNGIATTNAIGINYLDKWGKNKKNEITGSYFFNKSNTIANQNIRREFIFPSESRQIYEQVNSSSNINYNHRFNFKIDAKIDSLNSLLIRPSLSIQQNQGNSIINGSTSLSELGERNSANTTFNPDFSAINFNNDLLFRHAFKKKRRSLTLGAGTGYNNRQGKSSLISENLYFDDFSSQDLLNQTSRLNANGMVLRSSITYTEPIDSASTIQLTYQNSWTKQSSDKNTFNISLTTVNESLDTTLTNRFDSEYLTNSVGIGYRYNKRKTMLSVGANYQLATLRNEQEFPSVYSLRRNFQNILPNAMWRVNISKAKNIRFTYRSSTNAPALAQLQEVPDNTNPLQITTGNINLKQDWQHQFFARYSATNAEKLTTFFGMIGGSYNFNYIGRNTFIALEDTNIGNIFIRSGTQIIRPVNVDGYFNLRSVASYGMPLAFIKSKLNVNLFANYARIPSLINNQLNHSQSPNFGLSLVLASNISENVDFTLSSNSNYNIVRNTLQQNLNRQFFNQNTKLSLNIVLFKGIVINSELNHQAYNGLSQGYNTNFLLWNASIGKKLFKNQNGDLRLTAFDILKQNNSIQRNITDAYLEDIQSTILQRYFMLVFTYNIRNFRADKQAHLENE